MTRKRRLRSLALIQGMYFVTTGVWPLLDMLSFERVTGPKTDRWLVRTVGVLVAAIGASLMSAGIRQRLTGEVVGLAVGSAAGLALIDITYTAERRISSIYLADALLEVALVSGWIEALNITEVSQLT